MEKPDIEIGDRILVSRIGPDGRIWLDAVVVWVGKVTFKAELPGSILRTLEYSSKDWRR